MPRAIWKGAISFGLVYIPVQMHSASRSNTLDLDFLDRRDFSPVGYQRVNKRTGKVVEWADIVKGYQYEKGEYVALSDEDFRQANVQATQTIDIMQFTDATSVPPELFETPYYLAPVKGGEKVYALLREALKRAGKVAIATFVMRGRQHLAMVHPGGRALVLNTLRFAEEVKSPDDLDLPAAAEKAAGLAPKELAMAGKLIEEMSGKWDPAALHDTYREDLMARIKQKIRNHETHKLTPDEKPRESRQKAEVIDLMEVLRKSLKQGGGAGARAGSTGTGGGRKPRAPRGATRAKRHAASKSASARTRRRA